jgi:phosphoribosylglycinamide formyltransferase 1
MAGLNVAVLISGRGTNLQSLIDACGEAEFPARIALVLSDVPDVMGLDRAELDGIPTAVIERKDFEDKKKFEDAIHDALKKAKVDLVCLAGFMRLVSDTFVDRWHDKLINIHPSLLPAFKGLEVHERVLASGVRVSGCTVHFVRAEMDVGPIIVQAAVPVMPDDDTKALAARVLRQEHQIYPLAVRLIAEGRAKVVDERVVLDGVAMAETTLANPPPPEDAD